MTVLFLESLVCFFGIFRTFYFSSPCTEPLHDTVLRLPSVQTSLCSSCSVALMNHSCNPNVIVTYKGTAAEVRAVQDISPGEEVRLHSSSILLGSTAEF